MSRKKKDTFKKTITSLALSFSKKKEASVFFYQRNKRRLFRYSLG
jgi:hypothetical protein